MKSIMGKVAVITGAGSGIGRSIAHALAEAGAVVVVADVQQETAQAVAREIDVYGHRTMAVVCDVSDEASVAQLADLAFQTFGRVDILCNNAGVSMRPFRNIFDTTIGDWRFMFDVNFWGVLYGLMAFLPRMKMQDGEKHVVNTASLSGLFAMEGHAIYSASKAAVANLTDSLARELAPYGFGVTNFCPGPVATNLGENISKVWKEASPPQTRQVDPVDMETMRRVGQMHMPDISEVGVMVREAILLNQLYLHTAALPSDVVIDQIAKMFAGQTIMRPKV